MDDCPFVSVVVVNYNGLAYLADCLRSLERQNYPRHRFEVLLVDNGSTDGSVELVRTTFPWVHLIASKDNLGFAGGNNVGFALARGEWIALLNPDAAADANWLLNAVTAGYEAHDIGGVACHL